MRTGKHTVRDVFCQVCHAILGWRYVSYPHCFVGNAADLKDFAFEPDQKYKEGRFILEKEMIIERPENRNPTRGLIEELPVRELLARV
jgi:hypothetical protein